MPAHRLPWFKMWPEAMSHEKVALLPDPVFRTWVMAVASGSQQRVRGRFASAKHVAIVTGRPLAHVRQLIKSRLLDEDADGSVRVHDWRAWQDVHPSDFAPKSDAEHSANTPRTLRKNTPDRSPEIKRRDEERERDTSGGVSEGDTTGADAPPTHPPKPTTGRPSGEKTPVPSDFCLTDERYAFGASLGLSRERVDLETQKFFDRGRDNGKESADWDAAWRNWLRNPIASAQSGQGPSGPHARNGTRAGPSPPTSSAAAELRQRATQRQRQNAQPAVAPAGPRTTEA